MGRIQCFMFSRLAGTMLIGHQTESRSDKIGDLWLILVNIVFTSVYGSVCVGVQVILFDMSVRVSMLLLPLCRCVRVSPRA